MMKRTALVIISMQHECESIATMHETALIQVDIIPFTARFCTSLGLIGDLESESRFESLENRHRLRIPH